MIKQITKIAVNDNKVLTLDRTKLFPDEVIIIVCKLIQQTARDFQNFYYSEDPVEKEIFEETAEFIYEKDCFIALGDQEFNFEDLLDMVDINYDWFVEKLENKVFATRNK